MRGETLKDVIICTCLFSTAFLIRVAGIKNVCMYWDEWIYWSYTNEILKNNWIPTKEVFKCASPFLSYIGAIVTVLFEGDLYTLRMLSVIFGSLSVPFLYLFGKEMYNRNTGILAGLFLCFSPYHILFSDVIMLEAFALFFVVTFLYFFWLSQSKGRRIHAIIAGTLMGLAIDAKYLPIFLIPAIILYILWTKSIKVFNRQIILIFAFAFVFFSPMLLCFLFTGANPVYTYIYEVPQSRSFVLSRGFQTPPGGLIISGIERITEILAWNAEMLVPIWTNMFRFSVAMLFIITLLIYLYLTLVRRGRESFLVFSFICFSLLIFFVIPVKYYLIYLFPFYFVMLSHIIVKMWQEMTESEGYKKFFKIFFVLLAVIMLFSYFITGTMTPFLGKNEQSWVENALKFVEMDAKRDGYENITIGRIDFRDVIEYYLYRNNFNASSMSIVMPGSRYEKEEMVKINNEKIDRMKPEYIILSESQNNFFIITHCEKDILENYTVVFYARTYHYRRGHAYAGLVLKRKQVQPPEPLPECKCGEIAHDLFKESVPSVMKVGKVYTVLVKVKNVEENARNFIVRVYSENFLIKGDAKEININGKSSYLLKLKIVPFKKHVGELPITVDLYTVEENGTVLKADSVSDYVYLIL